MPAVKFAVSGMKFGTALPIRFVEWTSNKIFGFAEMVVIGCELPTNITQVYSHGQSQTSFCKCNPE